MTGERILLVEDSMELRHFLVGDILRPAGYDVLSAVDGDEGFTLARDLRPDLIIADYQMPGRDGLSMLRDLRQEGIEGPFILITAEGSEALAVEALRLGVSDYLIKPFDVDDLLNAISRVLRQHWTRKIAEHIPAQLLQTNRELGQRLNELDTLVTVGKRVTGKLNLREVLNEVVKAAVQLAGAEQGSLFLVDRASGELYLYASSDEMPSKENLRLSVSDSLPGSVVRTREPLTLAGEELQKIKTHYFFRSLIYVPLVLKDHVLGVLGVHNRETDAEFGDHALQLLSVLADFAAIAIENAQLYAITESERDTLNTILRDTEDAIIVTDETNNVVFCNPAARRTFRLSDAVCQGIPIAEAIPHAQVVDLFAKEARSGRSRRSEIYLDDGASVLNAQLTIIESVGRVVVMQDITHLKELDRIKSEFVTAVSHDLRSPLTAILGYVEMVQRSGELNEAQQTFIERIVFSARSITTLISDLLELGKIEAGFDEDREPVYLPAVMDDAFESVRHQWESRLQRVHVDIPSECPPVLGNPLRLRQMIANLVENAVKYTPREGEVSIGLETDGEFLILRVRDTGIGIPAKDQPYIFDKFYRTDEAIDNYEGTGLGLSIVKSIVEAHNGRIWVDSQVGAGTTFTIMLPAYDPDAVPRSSI